MRENFAADGQLGRHPVQNATLHTTLNAQHHMIDHPFMCSDERVGTKMYDGRRWDNYTHGISTGTGGEKVALMGGGAMGCAGHLLNSFQQRARIPRQLLKALGARGKVHGERFKLGVRVGMRRR